MEIALVVLGINLGFVLGAWFQSRVAATYGVKLAIRALRKQLESEPNDFRRFQLMHQFLREE